MNDNIRELLRSNDIEDILLGIELLHKTGNEEYFRRSSYKIEFVPGLLFKELIRDEGPYPFEPVYNYCEQNNYWIYE